MHTLVSYCVFTCAILASSITTQAAAPTPTEKSRRSSIEQENPPKQIAEDEKKKKAAETLVPKVDYQFPKDNLIEQRCTDWLTGSMNPTGICYLNTALQLLHEISCDKEVWSYIQKARPAKRLMPLRKALLNFISHYTEPRVKWVEDKQDYVADTGQKWVDAVAAELPKLNLSRFHFSGGGSEYLALLYMLEALLGESVSMNFELKHTKRFNVPVGIFLSTTFLRYGPANLKDKDALDTFSQRLLAMPGITWLERALAFQAKQEKMHYRKSAWPKFLLVINYDGPSGHDAPEREEEIITEESTDEEIEHFNVTAQFCSFPLTLNLHKIGLCPEPLAYTCRGFSLNKVDHVIAVIHHNNVWQWLDDMVMDWQPHIEKRVNEVSAAGKITISYGDEHPTQTFASNSLYLYVRD